MNSLCRVPRASAKTTFSSPFWPVSRGRHIIVSVSHLRPELPLTSPGKQLRELVADATIQVPGAPSALFARLIERCGYEAVYLSGAAFSTGILGLPDVGLFTLTELAQQTSYVTRACALPLIVDADTGFGEALNVERTVIELEAADAAAIQIED